MKKMFCSAVLKELNSEDAKDVPYRFSSCITNPNIIGKPLEEIFEDLNKIGFDGIDIPCAPEIYPIETILKFLESYLSPNKCDIKISIAEITAMINPFRDLSNPNIKIRRNAVNYIKKCIDYSYKLSNLKIDVPTHFCFISTPNILNEYNLSKLQKYAIESIKELISYATDRNVRILIEPLFRGDNTIIHTCKEAVELFSKALGWDDKTFMQGKHNFGLLQDIYHMHIEEQDIIQAIKEYSKITYHVHVADHKRALNFPNTPSNFVKKALNTYKNMGYKGYISFESFDKSVNLNTLKESLIQLKNLTL